MNKQLTFLLALTFLFLFSGSVYGDDLQDGVDAFKRQDYKEAVRLFHLSAEQGNAQYNLGNQYKLGQGVPQDYASAHMWWNICGSGGNKKQNHACVKQRGIIEKRMSPSQIEEAQRLARNRKPTK